MKRPEGFDKAAAHPSGPFAELKRTAHADKPEQVNRPEQTNTPERAAQLERPRAADTEPIAVIKPETEERQKPRTAQVSVRRARRERKRFERGEVKRFTKRTRQRRRVWLGSIGVVVVVLGVAVVTAFSPIMALSKIEVVGTSRLQAASVSDALKGQLGRPLPLIDFGSVKSELAHFSLIRSYSTETRPPGTLVIRIVERQPLGVLHTASAYKLVDEAGVVISTTKDRPAGFPVIELTNNSAATSTKSGFAASAAVLGTLPASMLPQVGSVVATTADDVTLTLTGGQKVLWGGPGRSALKAADLAALMKDAPGASGYDVSSPESPVTQ